MLTCCHGHRLHITLDGDIVNWSIVLVTLDILFLSVFFNGFKNLVVGLPIALGVGMFSRCVINLIIKLVVGLPIASRVGIPVRCWFLLRF